MEGFKSVNSFVGTYRCTVDKKGRIMIPARFRHAIPDELKDALILSKGKEECLELYPLPHWNRIIERVMNMEPGKTKKNFIRFYSENSIQVGIDKAGRVALPPRFLEEIGSPKQIVIVGMLTYMELWAPEQYEVTAEAAEKAFRESDVEFD